MPTYDYKCDGCGHTFERFESMSAKPIKKCPICGKNKLRRLIGTGAGLIFKGSGFYITDYRDQGYKDKAKADSAEPAEAKSDSKADAKSDSKPEAKADSQAETKTESKPSGGEAAPKAAESKPAAATTKAEPKASRSAKKK